MRKRPAVDRVHLTHRRLAAALLCLAALAPTVAWAGPPFFTDDPEPVELHHGEFYVASQYAKNADGYAATAPHLELNYGPLRDMQLHAIFPMGLVRGTGGPTNYGVGDTELGVKYRFLHETDTTPQVGTFPLVLIPTGNKDKGLGSGETAVFLPIWLQKSFGKWLTYGGAGYWINPGAGNSNFLQAGWLVQREVVKALSLGAELFYQTKRTDAGESRLAFNVGAIINLTEDYHVLLSVGRDLEGDDAKNTLAAYAAFQWTFGGHEAEGAPGKATDEGKAHSVNKPRDGEKG